MNNRIGVISINKIMPAAFDASLFLYFVAYFFYYKENSFDSYVRLISTIAILLTGGYYSLKRIHNIPKSTLWYFAFLMFGILSALWAVDSSKVFLIIPTMIRILLVGHFIYCRARTSKDLERVLLVYILATFYMSLAILRLQLNYYSFANILIQRLGDNFGYNSNTTAIYCMTSCLLLIAFLSFKKFRLLCCIGITYFTFVVIISGSKKGIFGLLMGVLLYFYYDSKGKKRVQNTLLATIVLIASLYAIMNIPFLYEAIGQRISAMVTSFKGDTSSSFSTSVRMELINAGLKIWEDNPILGVGLNNFSVVQHVHSDYYSHCNYIEILSGLGILGLVLFYTLPIKCAITKINQGDKVMCMLKAIICILLFLDVAAVTYQEIGHIIFYWISIAYFEKKSVENACMR